MKDLVLISKPRRPNPGKIDRKLPGAAASIGRRYRKTELLQSVALDTRGSGGVERPPAVRPVSRLPNPDRHTRPRESAGKRAAPLGYLHDLGLQAGHYLHASHPSSISPCGDSVSGISTLSSLQALIRLSESNSSMTGDIVRLNPPQWRGLGE